MASPRRKPRPKAKPPKNAQKGPTKRRTRTSTTPAFPTQPPKPPTTPRPPQTAEHARLHEHTARGIATPVAQWKRWGPYVSERAWGTVREDYSHDGAAWDYFPHDHARSRAYRWGEDGLAAICDRYQLLVFAMAFWNGRDPILKERLFGLVPGEANHGEDVKEYYVCLDSTPTHSYM